jgi:hypothetical protein
LTKELQTHSSHVERTYICLHACRYKLLKSVAKEYRGRIDFVWIEGGAQPELEAALNLGFGNLSDVRTSLV